MLIAYFMLWLTVAVSMQVDVQMIIVNSLNAEDVVFNFLCQHVCNIGTVLQRLEAGEYSFR